jgi:hypothetical protein
MVTVFTTAKPFIGHNATIQRNALKSWKMLCSDIDVILFGDEEGAAKVCSDLELRHERYVERNEVGLKRIDYYFDRAQEIARHDVLCYVNCDIVLMRDFLRAVGQVKDAHDRFLMVGRRWDTNIQEPINFVVSSWETDIWQRAVLAGHQRDDKWIDYFAFPRKLYYKNVPPFVVGRTAWDNWLVWRAAATGAAVIDASAVVRAVHQNHDYSYHPDGKAGVWNDAQAQRNFTMAGGWKHMWTIADAKYILRPEGFRINAARYLQRVKRMLHALGRTLRYRVWNPSWFLVLDITRPLRTALGLRSKNL